MGVGAAPQRGQGREHRAHALLHGAVEPAMTAATASPDVPAAVKALTDQAAIAKLLAETVIQEQALDEELEQLLSKREALNANLKTLDIGAEVLEVVQADAEHMADSIRATCELAERVSGKVRELDHAQGRVSDTIARLHAIADRLACLDGVSKALSGEDYETAAGYVATFLQLEEKYSGNSVGEEAGQAAEQREQLMAAKRKLEEIVRTRFTAAASAGDHEGALRFVKIYPKLGLATEGLGHFCTYLRSSVAARARADYESLTDALRSTAPPLPTAPTFVSTLTNLFKDIALAVEDNEEVLSSEFGAGAAQRAVTELHAECDARGAQILRRFIDHRQLQRLCQAVSRRAAGEAAPDPREVESHLEEMLLLCQRSEEYNAFMLAKLRSGSGGLSPAAANSFKTGQFNRVVHEMVGHYIGLEEFYMVENVAKAIRIDEHSGGGLTSSMVDDVFYILLSSGRRAGATASLQCVCAVLNHVNNLLSNEYRNALTAKIRGAASRMLTAAPGASPVALEAAAAINNADVSAEYVVKLKKELEEFLGELFPASAERERVRSCMGEMSDTAAHFRALAQAGLDELLSGLAPRLRPFLDVASGAKYTLSEAEYAENEADDPWVLRLIAAAEGALGWTQTLLTTGNYDALVSALVDSIGSRLEAIVWQKRFNQLGGLQLDRDMRTLVNQLSELTSRTVRDKFARLTQIATVLNLESVEEILDYWGENAGALTWRLSAVEVKRALGLRVDFRAEAIQALKL